jgi:hypothetical protein
MIHDGGEIHVIYYHGLYKVEDLSFAMFKGKLISLLKAEVAEISRIPVGNLKLFHSSADGKTEKFLGETRVVNPSSKNVLDIQDTSNSVTVSSEGVFRDSTVYAIDYGMLSEFVETRFPDIPPGTGSVYLDSLRPYSVNQICRMACGDILSDKITYNKEFEGFLKVSNGNNHSNIWKNRDLAKSLYDREDHHPEWDLVKYYDLLDGSDYSVLWDTIYENRKPPYLSELKLIQKQMSGLCFLHSAACLAHYEVVVGSDGKETKMIDLSKIIEVYCVKENLNLKNFVTDDSGGFSALALSYFLSLKISDYLILKASSPTRHPDFFKAFWTVCALRLAMGKVALVENMTVYQSLHDYESGSPLEVDPETREPSGVRDGEHSLLLIGILKQTVSTGPQYYLLLQNWWTGKYFITMNVEYFVACNPTIYWIERSVRSYAADVNVLNVFNNYQPFAETAVDRVSLRQPEGGWRLVRSMRHQTR